MATVESFKRADGSTYYRARINLADGTRERVDVPEKYNVAAGGMSAEERRQLYADAVQEREDEKGELLAKKRERIAAKAASKLPPVGPETITRYRERLNEHREELGLGKGDPSAWSAWINPHLGPLPVATVTRDQIEDFRDLLDAQIATHKKTEGREGLSGKRALNIWSEVTTTFKAAKGGKRRELRVRDDNPCDGIQPPEKGESKRKTFIYPAEMQALLASDAPLEWREVYAIGSYLYLRPGELRALTWADVDIKARVVHVTKAYDERGGETKTPKTTKGVRDVPIEPALVPLLERMRKGREPHDLVVPVLAKLTENRRATNIRLDLQRAGCTRPRLYEETATTMGVNFRSLRDSGITWLALAGVDVVRMQRRAGHESLETTGGYIKQAEDLTGNIGEPFGPLPESLLRGVEPEGGGGSRQRIAAQRRLAKLPKRLPKRAGHRAEVAQNSALLEVRAGLVPAPVFKTGGLVLHGAAGGFDSHALPPIAGLLGVILTHRSQRDPTVRRTVADYLEQRAGDFRAAIDERIHFLNMLHIVVDVGLRGLGSDPAAQLRVERGRYSGKHYSAGDILAEFEPRAHELAEIAHIDLFGAFDLLLEDLFAWAWHEHHAGRWPATGFDPGELGAPDEAALRWNWKKVRPAKRIDRLATIMRVVPYLFHLDHHATHRVIRNALAHDGGVIKQGALDEACLARIAVKGDEGAETTVSDSGRARRSDEVVSS